MGLNPDNFASARIHAQSEEHSPRRGNSPASRPSPWAAAGGTDETAIELRIDKEPATLRRKVEDRLRAAIATGHFRPGQRLVERELCEALGVSRTSLREAFRQLEADGLVVAVPHRGPEVASISAAEAAQLYELRALRESFAGRAFAERGSPEEAEAMSASIDRFERAATGRRARHRRPRKRGGSGEGDGPAAAARTTSSTSNGYRMLGAPTRRPVAKLISRSYCRHDRNADA